MPFWKFALAQLKIAAGNSRSRKSGREDTVKGRIATSVPTPIVPALGAARAESWRWIARQGLQRLIARATEVSTIVTCRGFVNLFTVFNAIKAQDALSRSTMQVAQGQSGHTEKLGALLGPLAWDDLSREESRNRTDVANSTPRCQKCEKGTLEVPFFSAAAPGNQSQER